MNERELREIKRRFRAERCNASSVRGCLVNENGQIAARINHSLGLGDEVSAEKLLSVMKKTLSGALGTQLTDIAFRTKDVESSEEHKLLMQLRSSALNDDAALDSLYSKIIESVKIEGRYAILLLHDTYDVQTKREDGGEVESSTVYTYFVCAVCPVKSVEGGLGFKEGEGKFQSIMSSLVLQRPECGFLFPAFDDRCANIYDALFYSRSVKENQAPLVSALFGKEAPMPPASQKEKFGEAVAESLGDGCELSLLRAVHAEIAEMVEAHREEKNPEPLTLSAEVLRSAVLTAGAEESAADEFKKKIDESFGAGAMISPKNILNVKQFELRTPDVVIKVNPERRDLVTTEVIDGQKYILIKAESGVELNGIAVSVNED